MEARGGVRSSARLSSEAAAARTPSSSGNGGPGRPAVDAAAAALRRARAAERAREIEDSPRVLREKCRRLARALRNAKHLVVYTGAGISTAADIPDYRGPHGVWTRLQRGETVGRVEVSRAQPTFTHMALTALWARGTLKFVVSQNCDGLHLRAGLPRRALAELHGDMFAELCGACRRVYLRAFDTTERTARHAHGTRRLCHACGAELRDSIVHFGERGRAAWPLNWAGALRHAAQADVVLCLGSSLKVLRRYPRLWRMQAPPRARPALYIVNLQWTPKDAVAALKINARCDVVMRQVARRLRLRVPRYRAEADPLLAHAEPLAPGEAHTTRRPLLAAPGLSDSDPEPDLLSSPSASDSDEELPLRRLAERLRAPRSPRLDGRPSPDESSDTEPSYPNTRPPSPDSNPRSNARFSSPEPSLPSLPHTRAPSPDEESRSQDARFLPPDTGPPAPPSETVPSQNHVTVRSQNHIAPSQNHKPPSPKIESSATPKPEWEPEPPPLKFDDQLLSFDARRPPSISLLPKSAEPPSLTSPPIPTKISPTAKRPPPDLLRAFQVSMRSGEATILLRAQHAPPPPPPPARPALHALRSFRMIRPRPPLTLNGNHLPKLGDFVVKKEEFVPKIGNVEKKEVFVKKEEVQIKKGEGLIRQEEGLIKKEELEEPKREDEAPLGLGLGSRLRRLLECEPRLGLDDDKADSSGEECGARALAAAYIARAVLVCRAQLYPGLHTIIAPPPPRAPHARAPRARADCAWCFRRHAARRCLWYGPPRCTPPARRRRLCACCDPATGPPRAADPADPADADDADGGGWYGKGYRKGRRRRR